MAMPFTPSRRDFIGAMAALPAAAQLSAQSATPRRSVMLLIGDDHGFEMGAYSHPVIQTPNLDRLAAEGVRFTNAFCTTASCSASRSVILTGLHNHTNGQFGHAHGYNHFSSHDWVKSLPALLKPQGYTTGVIGKLHVEPAAIYPFDFSRLNDPRNVVRMAEEARQFFNQCAGTPFFLLVGFADPHRSALRFGNEKSYPGVEPVVYSPDDVIIPPFLPNQPEVRTELAEYYQSVSRMDLGVGMMLKALEAAGRSDETLVLYISDNGMPFPGAKTTLYDPGVNLPMIVRSPAQKERSRVQDAMVTYTSITPTILDWTGVPPPDYPLHGASILPILEESSPKGWDEVYFSHTFHEITMCYPMRGMRTRKYKYLHNLIHDQVYPFASDLYDSPTWQGVLQRGDKQMGVKNVEAFLRRPEEELYDLENDPHELHNLAGSEKYAAVLEDLREKTRAFQKSTQDPWWIGDRGMHPHRLWAG